MIAADDCLLSLEFDLARRDLSLNDFQEMSSAGISLSTIGELVGTARVELTPDGTRYRPARGGARCFIIPVRVQPDDETPSPISHWPEATVRVGEIFDLVALDPLFPEQWALRRGVAAWLGSAPPQRWDAAPVRVSRTPLAWLQGDADGIVIITRDRAAAGALLNKFRWFICDDTAHEAELLALRNSVPHSYVTANLRRMA